MREMWKRPLAPRKGSGQLASRNGRRHLVEDNHTIAVQLEAALRRSAAASARLIEDLDGRGRGKP
jgi:hypothetical protein